MSSPLSSAVARCHLRRLRGLTLAGPLPALVVAAIVVAAPLACVRLGSALGAELHGSLESSGVPGALLGGPALAAAAAGMALAVSLPGRAALGFLVAAAPFPDRVAVVASCLVPAACCTAAVAPALLAFDLALAIRLDRGLAVGGALALATATAVPAGAILAEGGLAAARGAWRQAGLVAAGTGVWVAGGWMAGQAPLGPLGPAAHALRGDGRGMPACAVAVGSFVALASVWILLAARRPEPAMRSPRSPLRIVRGGPGTTLAALTALLTRRGDVRVAAVGAVAFGAAGVAVAALSAAPPPAAFMLGTTTAVLGSVVAPLAVFVVLRDGRWLWRGAPRGCYGIARAAWLVGLVVTAAPVFVVAVAALLAASASWSAVGTVAVIVAVAVDMAVVAGVLVPWGAGAGDQAATFAAFGAVAIAGSLAVGLLAPRVVALGAPDPLVAIVLCCAGGCAGVQALARGLGEARQ